MCYREAFLGTSRKVRSIQKAWAFSTGRRVLRVRPYGTAGARVGNFSILFFSFPQIDVIERTKILPRRQYTVYYNNITTEFLFVDFFEFFDRLNRLLIVHRAGPFVSCTRSYRTTRVMTAGRSRLVTVIILFCFKRFLIFSSQTAESARNDFFVFMTSIVFSDRRFVLAAHYRATRVARSVRKPRLSIEMSRF